MRTAEEQMARSAAAARGNRNLSARISKRLPAAGREFTLEIDIEVAPAITILFGASGAGKTTLLDCIAGLSTPDAGNITIGEKSFFDSDSGVDLPVHGRRIGYVFQELALFPHLSVTQNIRYGLARVDREEQKRRIDAILESFRITHLLDRKPGEISGGEQQRVALARALVTDPRVLLLDEPLAGLDAPTKAKIINDLRAWNRAHNIPIFYVTHTREEVFALGDRVIVLDNGHVVAQGTPHEVMSAPQQETVAQLAGFENIFEATVIAARGDRGTMTCRLGGSNVDLETPLFRAAIASSVRVGIRAGDILLATIRPDGLSARNVIPGAVVSVQQRDVIVSATVNCGVEMEVHLTLAAREALQLRAGAAVWLIVKTHSCHVMAG